MTNTHLISRLGDDWVLGLQVVQFLTGVMIHHSNWKQQIVINITNLHT